MSLHDANTSNITEPFESPAQWGWITKVIVSHFIVAVGLVANSLTFIVMTSPKLQYKSYSQYLSALAVFDSLVLISQEIHMANEILNQNDESLFIHFSDYACKVFMFADAVCNLMSSWLIVAMAMERLCVVYMPFRRNMWCQKVGAVIIIFTLFAVLSCTQAFRFMMVGNESGRCMGSLELDYLYIPLHIYVYQFALLFITPVFIVILCNIGVLIRVLSVERATRNEDSSRLTGSPRRRSKTTRMLVAISSTYILTTLPQLVLTIALYAIPKRYGIDATQVFLQTVPWINLSQAVTNINYASNFFIYILSGKKFRIELGRIFKHYRGSSFNGSTRTREEVMMMSL